MGHPTVWGPGAASRNCSSIWSKSRALGAWLAKGYNTLRVAWRTTEGIERVNLIHMSRVKWAAKNDVIAEARFIAKIFGLAA
jgi:hypothetical protein